MDRKQLDALAASNFATHHITRQDINDLRRLLEAAETRARQAETQATEVQRLSLTDVVVDVREKHALAQVLLDTLDTLDETIDRDGVAAEVVTRDLVRDLTAQLDTEDVGHATVARAFSVAPAGALITATHNLRGEAADLATTARAAEDVVETDGVFRVDVKGARPVTRATVRADVAALDAADTQHVTIERRASTRHNGTVVAIVREARDLAVDLVDTLNA